MKNQEAVALQGSIIINTAMEGSLINQLYTRHGAQGTKHMLAEGITDDDSATIATQTANELERLIRTGLSLAEVIHQMRKDGWADSICDGMQHREL
uniref:hypothetical protein n=1 Tax=uncultured Acinetobacter sp. TaxID=165433 RepID=UPI00260972EA|nr:hypothetical protein [uncultured Acinetobacter sp.]